MQNFGFTVKKNLASTIRDYLKSKGRNVSEEDINTILQRLIDVNAKRPPQKSIFSGGHKYYGGNGKDFIVQKDQQINLSVQEYNKIFEGYLDREEVFKIEHAEIKQEEIAQNDEHLPQQDEIKLSDEALKGIKNQTFKSSLSNMSDKQLNLIANSPNLTTDTEQLRMLASELRARGNQKGAEAIEKSIAEIEPPLLNKQEEDSTPDIPVTGNAPLTESQKHNTDSEQIIRAEIKINPTEEEIQSNITNLKSGESYTYLQVKNQSSWGYGQNQENITWTREKDGTLTKIKPDFQIDGNFGALTEKYTADGTQLLSRTKLGGIYLNKGLYTTTHYANSTPVTESTDLKDIYNTALENLSNAERILGLMSPEFGKYKNDEFKNNAISMDNQTFASKELKNQKGETVLTYKAGKFTDSKGTEIDNDNAAKIINNLLESQDLSELIKNYNTRV